METSNLNIEQLNSKIQSLEKELELYKTILNNLPISVFAKDVQNDYKYLIWNKELENFFGTKSEKIIGINDFELFDDKNEAKYFNDYDRSVMNGNNIIDIPCENLTTVVGVRKVHTRKIPIYNDKGEPIILLGCLEDITDKKRIEQELLLRESYLRAIIENQPGLIWLKDSDGRFLMVNAAFAIACNAGVPENVLGKTDFDIWDYDLAQSYSKDDAEVLETKKSKIVEELIVIDGKSVWYETFKTPIFDESGLVIGTSGFARDISYRKKAELELIKAKEKAEDNEQKYSRMIKILPDGIVIHRNGIIILANDAAMRIVGAKKTEEIINKNILDFIHPDYKELVKSRVNKSLNNNVNADFIEEVFVSLTGEKINVLVAGIPLSFHDGPAMLTVFTDISKLKATEKDLVRAKLKADENQYRLKVMLDAIPDLVFRIDRNGVFIDYKADNTKLYYQSDTIVGKNVADVLPLQIAEKTIFFIDIALKTSELQTFEYELFLPNNEIGIYETRMLMSGKDEVTAIVRDVTEQKMVQKSLNESIELLSLFIRYSPIYAYIKQVTETESYVLYASENFIDMVGVPVSEIYGKGMEDLFPHDFAKKIIQDDWAVVSKGELLRIDEEFNNKYYLTIKFPIKLNGKHLLAGYTIDITDRRIAEKMQKENQLQLKEQNEEYEALNEELKETNHLLNIAKEKAEESDKLKTAFLQNMSHEIRTPMNAIIGFTDFLDDPELTSDKRHSFVSIIQNSTNQLLSIITDILSISAIETKQEKVNIEKVNINSLLIELLSIFKKQAENKNIQVYAKQYLKDSESEVYTDRTKLTQILTNLLTNAIKFTHDGFIEFGYTLKDEFLEFYVKDTGIGIEAQYHDKIFERFHQANMDISKRYGGTGLGLAISKAFAELLKGDIWLESTPTKGSTFYFTIFYDPVNEFIGSNGNKDRVRHRKTILVAEDEEFNYLLLEETLLKLDFNVIHSKNGFDTVEICKTNPNIDLVLMDIKMPVLDGFSATKIIKGFRPKLPIIAQSAYALEHEKSKYESVFDDYLIKPIKKNELKKILAKYFETK